VWPVLILIDTCTGISTGGGAEVERVATTNCMERPHAEGPSKEEMGV
jgi:hypothetical protein